MRPSRLALVLALGALTSLGLTAGLTPGSSAAFVARITNSAATASTATNFTCAGAVATDRGSAFVAYALNEASGSTSAADSSGNARTGTYRGTMASSSAGRIACPRDTGGALVLNGSNTNVTTPTLLSTGPTTFSLEVWFATTTAGGKLIGFGNQQTTQSGQYDRQIWVSTTGVLSFGVYNGGTNVISSTAKVTDGLWHNVIVTFSAATGSTMYLDGAQVAANAAYGTAESHSGYWRIGWDNLAGWPNVGLNSYFTGSMRFAAVYTTVLTPAQVANHAAAGRNVS